MKIDDYAKYTKIKFRRLSVLIPAYNEGATIGRVIDMVEKVDLRTLRLEKELVIVNDRSTDNTVKSVKRAMKKYDNIKFYSHKTNRGKGAAVKTAIRNATGQIMIVQDADMEYDPNDYVACVKPILKGVTPVVYGSRRLKKSNKQHSAFSYLIGGVGITVVFNILYFQWLTDEPTCYKTFRSDIIKNIRIEGERFEWEPEVTAKIAKSGIKILEVPISYHPRHPGEGKKIKWIDGFHAIWALVKYRFKK